MVRCWAILSTRDHDRASTSQRLRCQPFFEFSLAMGLVLPLWKTLAERSAVTVHNQVVCTAYAFGHFLVNE